MNPHVSDWLEDQTFRLVGATAFRTDPYLIIAF
jgi:hypothetical protein